MKIIKRSFKKLRNKENQMKREENLNKKEQLKWKPKKQKKFL